MIRQVLSTESLAAVLTLAAGAPALAQQANPGAAKNPVAGQAANPCAATNPRAAKSPDATKDASEAKASAVANTPWDDSPKSFTDYKSKH